MIDILLSTFNGEKFLEEQLDSIFLQSYKDFNLIIRDDGSKDNTLEIISKYKALYSDKIIVVNNSNNKNLGSTNSFFELLHYSSSDLIMFCDQDDVWNPDKLEQILKFYYENVKEKEKPVLIHSAVEVVDEKLCTLPLQTEKFNQYKAGMEHKLIWQVFQNDVTGCTVMINSVMRDIVNQIDFSKNKVIQHDWFLALIAYLNKSKFYIPQQTMKYRQHSKNVIGIKHLTFSKRLLIRIKTGTTYPYYSQIKTLLLCSFPMNIDDLNLLTQFASLTSLNKISRVIWHIKHAFFRNGSFIYKMYQLIAC